MKTYAVRLSNGKYFSGLGVNCSYFTSKSEIKAEDIETGLKKVIITEHGSTNAGELETIPPVMPGEYENMTTGKILKFGEEYFFTLRPQDPEEYRELKNRSDIDFCLMMLGDDE